MTVNERLKGTCAYGGAAVLSLLIVVWVMELWKADLAVPFSYEGDALVFGMIVKGTIENRSYLHNPSLGMPGGMDMYDFPYPDGFNIFLIKLLSLFVSDYATVLNLFFLLTFPLTALTSICVFRRLGFSYFSAVVWSLIYTFIPFHFFRGQTHLFLTTYYFIPLVIMVALWVCSGKLLPASGGSNKPASGLNLWRSRFVLSIILCLLASSVGQGYHQFFACFFLLIAGLTTVFSQRNLRHLLASWILIGVTVAGSLINLAPALIYIYTHGRNSLAAKRGAQEAEIYGLKIAQLLLPISGHRISWLANLKEKYNSSLLNNENDVATLGVIGTIGFFILLGWLFYKRDESFSKDYHRSHDLLNHLSLLNVSGVLLATVGGFSSLFALLISPQIRSYNRISIFLGFFCILAVASLLEDFSRCRLRSTMQRIFFQALLGLTLVIAILDQTNEHFVPDYVRLRADFRNDSAFVGRIESLMPAHGTIFQLPYVPFPENPPIHKMTDYDHFRGYLHSKNLRWSYGAIKGRAGDDWQRAVSAAPVSDFVEALTFAGFSGIYLNRDAYPDNGVDVEAKLFSTLGASLLVSDDGRLIFFNLTEFREKLKAKFTPEEWEAQRDKTLFPLLVKQRDKTLFPLLVKWEGGFSDLESMPGADWRWCSSGGELHLINSSPHEKTVTLEMLFATGYAEEASLVLSGPLISEHVKVNSNPRFFSKTLSIPPGHHTVKFTCDARRVNAPRDPRHIVFKVVNFRLRG